MLLLINYIKLVTNLASLVEGGGFCEAKDGGRNCLKPYISSVLRKI